MNNRDFTYWMEGFFEISEPKSINDKQLTMIKEHIKLVSATEQISGFALWLDGFLKAKDLSGDENYLSAEETSAINNELRKQIKNVMKDGKFSPSLFDHARLDIGGAKIC